MPAHHRPLVTVVAERHSGVLLALVDVVGGAWGRGIADATGQALDPQEVLAFGCVELIVHRVSFPSTRLLASCDRQTSTLACAATISQRNCSSTSIAIWSFFSQSVYSGSL